MATPAKDGERRRFSRVAFHRPVELELQAGPASGELVDISLKGALVEIPVELDLRSGDRCIVSIRLDPAGEAIIRMEGEITHRERGCVGVRCDEIDLESIAHLRRLVELNVGDEDVLHRELAALVGERNALSPGAGAP
jgi:PilZ domain-containing protein